jgi:hypothetical protein
MNKLFKPKYVIYFIVLIWFVFYLIYANKFVAFIVSDEYSFYEADFLSYDSNSEVIFSLSNVTINRDLKETLSINGIAFCETDKDNSNKRIELILKSDNKAYAAKMPVQYRKDIYLKFSESSQLGGDYLYIACNLPTIGLDEGVYELYVYVWENDQNYGIKKTGLRFLKDRNGIKRYISSEAKMLNIPINDIRYNIDNVEKVDDGIQILGWAYIPGKDSKYQDVYIEVNGIQNKVYKATSYYREDVGTFYEDPNLNSSGFICIVPQDAVKDNDFDFKIIIDNKWGNSIQLDNTEVSEEVDDKRIVINEKEFLGSIDRIFKMNNRLVVQGWAAIENFDSKNIFPFVQVLLEDDISQMFQTTKMERPDVVEYFNNSLYLSSGYIAYLPENINNSKKWYIRSVIKVGDEYFAGQYIDSSTLNIEK